MLKNTKKSSNIILKLLPNVAKIKSMKFSCAYITEMKNMKIGSVVFCKKMNAVGIVTSLKKNKDSMVVFFSGSENLSSKSYVFSNNNKLMCNFTLNDLGKVILNNFKI